MSRCDNCTPMNKETLKVSKTFRVCISKLMPLILRDKSRVTHKIYGVTVGVGVSVNVGVGVKVAAATGATTVRLDDAGL